MKRAIACFAVFCILVSFKSDALKTFHYPEFMVAYDQKALPGTPAWEGFSNGAFVPRAAQDFLEGIDSVAVKYIVKGKHVYTNFYSRAGAQKWNKYTADKKFLGVITERRSEESFRDDRAPVDCAIYYKVR